MTTHHDTSSELPTAGIVCFLAHDSKLLADIFMAPRNRRERGFSALEPDTRALDDDLAMLRRSLNATYSAGRILHGTHGAADPPSYDWVVAMHDSRSVEEVIGAASVKLPSTLIDRVRYLRSYDQSHVRGRDPMSIDSVKSALRFLISHADLPHPTIVETLSGHIMLEWNVSKQRYLAIEFVGGLVYFFLIDGPNRVKGKIAAEHIADMLRLDVVKGWR